MANMDLNDWAHIESDAVIEYIRRGDFSGLLNRCFATGGDISVSQMSRLLNCSCRSVRRYKDGKRKIPMDILKTLASILRIDCNTLFSNMDDKCDTFCRKYLLDVVDDCIVWYGKERDLINSLYFYRTKILNKSLFEMAWDLEISVERLAEYESGKVNIYKNDVIKICNILNIKFEELYPQLKSFDGGNTYLPFNCGLFIKDKNNGELLDFTDNYIDIHEHNVLFLQEWPIGRYNRDGKYLTNVFPNELSVDEYYNMCSVLLDFMEEDNLKLPEFDILQLPPSYYRYEICYIHNDQSREYLKYNKKEIKTYSSIGFSDEDNYKLYLYCDNETKPEILDLTCYIESNSIWFGLLKQKDYFTQARLIFADEADTNTQCIIWPDGQYIRIIDIPLDINPYGLSPKLKSLRYVGDIANWLVWD